MGEPSFYCQLPSEGCCLNYPETIIVLVALIIVVQLALKLAAVICYYLWYLLGIMFGMVVVQAPEKPRRTLSRAKKIHAPAKAKPSLRWSEDDVPPHRSRSHQRRPRPCRRRDIPCRRRDSRSASRSPSRHCLHCTLDPVKVTMNLKNAEATDGHYHLGHRAYVSYPPPPPHYYAYESEAWPRRRRASAPSGYASTRYRERDTTAGSSDPQLAVPLERRRSVALAPETVRRKWASTKHPESRSRSDRRSAKVYIYPVHPQTPPRSRSSSRERPHRRHRRHRHRRVHTSSLEDQQAPELPPHRAREAEQQTGTPLQYHAGSTNLAQGVHAPTEPPASKPRYYWSDQVTTADWVYRPVK